MTREQIRPLVSYTIHLVMEVRMTINSALVDPRVAILSPHMNAVLSVVLNSCVYQNHARKVSGKTIPVLGAEAQRALTVLYMMQLQKLGKDLKAIPFDAAKIEAMMEERHRLKEKHIDELTDDLVKLLARQPINS